MAVHKPKAVRSWKDFAVEIGTIICGILIALGLEQTVDVFRTAREVADARDALHQEMARNLGVAATWTPRPTCRPAPRSPRPAGATAAVTAAVAGEQEPIQLLSPTVHCVRALELVGLRM